MGRALSIFLDVGNSLFLDLGGIYMSAFRSMIINGPMDLNKCKSRGNEELKDLKARWYIFLSLNSMEFAPSAN